MWLPKKLILKSFISHLDTTFEFASGQATMIQGINVDDECQESNGSGKSGIIEGICFTMTGDSFRKVRAEVLIMDEYQTAETEMEFYNTVSKMKLVINRELDRKKGSTITIAINGIPKVLPSVNEYNKFILEIFDITKEDLMNYFIISKEKYQSFLLSGDVKKKEVIARFSNSNLIDGVEKLVDADVQVIVDKITKLENSKNRLDGQIEVYEEQITNASNKKEFDESNKVKIQELNVKITDYKASITNHDNSIEQNKKMLLEANKKLSGISIDDLNKKFKKAEDNENAILKLGKELKASAGEYEELIAEMNKNLAGVVQCPKCDFEFVATEKDFDVVQGRETVEALKVELSDIKSDIVVKQDEYRKAEVAKNNVKAEIRKIEQLKHEIELEVKKYNNAIENCESSKKSIALQIKGVEDSIKSIKETVFTSNIEQVKNKISEIKKEIMNFDIDICKLNLDKQTLVEWVYNFKKFRTHLTNKSIRTIESFTNMYLTKIRTNLAVKMDGYKLLADKKTVRENITIEVLRNGMVNGPIEKFSGGEKVRIDICNILALQKLINLNSNSGGLDLLLLDEIVESVDSVGVTEILNQLNSINQTIAIITHANTIKDFDNVVVIIKENGCSSIYKA